MAFRNQVSALSQLVADTITGATITGATITGGIFRTAASGKRWELTSTIRNKILGYSGNPDEVAPGVIEVDHDAANDASFVSLRSGQFSAGGPQAWLDLTTENLFGPVTTAAVMSADTVALQTATQSVALDSAGLQIGTAGTPIRSISFGRANGLTTNASSQVTFNHGLGTTPLAIIVLPATGHIVRRATHTATTATIEARSAATGALVGGGVIVNLDYITIA